MTLQFFFFFSTLRSIHWPKTETYSEEGSTTRRFWSTKWTTIFQSTWYYNIISLKTKETRGGGVKVSISRIFLYKSFMCSFSVLKFQVCSFIAQKCKRKSHSYNFGEIDHRPLLGRHAADKIYLMVYFSQLFFSQTVYFYKALNIDSRFANQKSSNSVVKC